MSLARDVRSASLVEGEFAFTQDDFRRIAEIMRDMSGIHLPEAKATLVYSRLAKRIRTLKLDSFSTYVAMVSRSENEAERLAMLAALTTNVTSFFREQHHFDHLRDRVLPRLAAEARAGGRVRLWSSACSTGQEPYSIALTLLSVLPEASRLDVRILATDIDPNVVRTAKAGLYPADLMASIPAALRERWIVKERGDTQGRWRVADEVRSLITFNTLNLIGDWPMRGKFDAIFCRNVVIYFEERTQNLLWRKFKERLTPEGRLYIGHSERVGVEGYASDGLTVYRLSHAGAP